MLSLRIQSTRAGRLSISVLLGLVVVSSTSPAQAQAPAGSKQKQFLAFDAPARELLGKMTLEEKIGQMIQPDQAFLKEPGEIAKYYLGSVLSGGGSGPKEKVDYNLKGWTDLVDGYQKQALTTRLAIPLVYGIDAVHGNNNIPGAVVFPHQIGLGCSRDADLVQEVAQITAEEVRAIGVNWDFAPCVAVPQDERWGRTYEGFGEDPALVKELGLAAVQGLQGKDLADKLSVLACAKHFIGDGGTVPGSGMGGGKVSQDQGNTPVDEATLRRVHMAGYISTINAGVGTIMPSYSSWNGVKCSASKPLMTDLLKGELGFEGFLISDYNAIDQLGTDYKQAAMISVNAGMDMIMVTNRYADLFNNLKELVGEGKIPQSRIDDAVTRILRVKLAMGLMKPGYSPLTDRSLHQTFGSPAHRAVARRAVRESLVLLKNERNVLPLPKTARVHLAGRGVDSLGMQCGGWTIDWQGKMENDVPGGITIANGCKGVAGASAEFSQSTDGTGAKGADVGVVVIGEKPYSEFMGDNADLTLSQEDIEAVANVKKAGVPVVVVILSGRPLVLGPVLDQADAIIAAWLPGSEGDGVADVLYGDYAPTGKLARSWPKATSQANQTIMSEGITLDPQFAYGFGLTYGAKP